MLILLIRVEMQRGPGTRKLTLRLCVSLRVYTLNYIIVKLNFKQITKCFNM